MRIEATDEAVDRTPRSRHSRTLVFSIAGMLIGTMVAGTAATLGTRGSDLNDTLPLAASSTLEEEPSEVEVVEAGASDQLASALTLTHEVYLSRDPFDPVVPEPEPTATPVDAAAAGELPGEAPSAPGGDGSSPVTGTDGLPQPPEAAPQCSQDSPACGEQAVTVMEIGARSDGTSSAVLQIGTIVYDVVIDDTAGYYIVTDIEPSCVSLLYGDHGFRRCLGDDRLK